MKLVSHLFLTLVNGHGKKEEWADSYCFWYTGTKSFLFTYELRLPGSLATKNNVYDSLSAPLISLLWMLPNYWKEIQHLLGGLLCKCFWNTTAFWMCNLVIRWLVECLPHTEPQDIFLKSTFFNPITYLWAADLGSWALIVNFFWASDFHVAYGTA